MNEEDSFNLDDYIIENEDVSTFQFQDEMVLLRVMHRQSKKIFAVKCVR
jgi:hypothetical protein